MLELAAVVVTIIGYILARIVTKKMPRLLPLIPAVLFVWLFWWLSGGDWQAYQRGGEWISFFLGPATVALAVPLAQQKRDLKKYGSSILAGVTAGCTVAIISTWLAVSLFGGSDDLLRSMLSKSVTTPIALELTNLIDGVPALTALFTALTGIIGGALARPVLKLAGVTDDWAIGLAVGTSAHAIGTAGLLLHSRRQAAASSLAMIVAGVVTSIYFVPLQFYFH